MSKITMVAAFGTGYVLGAKAGRERYEQLSAKAQQLWSHPKVQEQASKVQEQAGKVQDQAKDRWGKAKNGDRDTESDPWPASADGVLTGGEAEDGRG